MSNKSKHKGPGKVKRTQYEQLMELYQLSQAKNRQLLDALADLSVALMNGKEILDEIEVEASLGSGGDSEVSTPEEALNNVRELLQTNDRVIFNYIIEQAVPDHALSHEGVRRCIARLCRQVLEKVQAERKRQVEETGKSYFPELKDKDMCMVLGPPMEEDTPASRYMELEKRVYGAAAAGLL